MSESTSRTPAGSDVLQVRTALIGLLLSVITTSVIPLFAVILTVTLFAIYSNGHVTSDAVAGGTS